MTVGDVVRWSFIVVCIFSIGAMLGLYGRVGRLFLPKVWMRLLFIANGLSLAVIAIGIHARLGSSLTWRTPILAVAAGMQLVALLGLHFWYGTEEGRMHSARMTRSMTEGK